MDAFCSVWLTDLSRQVHPTCQLDGFDISLSQAEPQVWIPSNVNLHQWDINTEPNPELQGKYDIVHIRLFVFVVQKDPRPLLRKLLQLLSTYSFPGDPVAAFANAR